MSEKIVRLGGASGFWGDTPEGARQLVYSGQVDYLVMDYLAEITMSLLARAKAKDPAMGYPPDFVAQFIAPLRQGNRRAGDQGRVQCRRRQSDRLQATAVEKVLAEQGVKLRVAAIVGDDIHGMVEELRGRGERNSVRRRDAGQGRLRQRLYRRIPDRRRPGRRRGYRRHRPRRRQRAGAGAADP